MRELDSFGTFWIQTRPDDIFTGTVKYGPAAGARLSLVGDDSEIRSIEDANATDPFIICGVIDRGPVTMGDCSFAGSRRRPHGTSEAKFSANFLLIGHHFKPDEMVFSEGDLRTSEGVDWVGRRIQTENDDSDREPGIEIKQLNYSRPTTRKASFSRGTVSISYSYLMSGSNSVENLTFNHWPVFGLEYATPTNLEDLRQDLGRIESLVTLCADAVSVPQEILLRKPELKVRLLNGRETEFPAEIEYLAPLNQAELLSGRKRRHPHQMLLTFDELGGVDRIARWLDIAPTFGRALDSMISIKNVRTMYTENRFLNVAFAAEAYHRDVYGSGESMPATEFQGLLGQLLGATPTQHHDWLRQRLSHANDLSFRRRLRHLMEVAGEPASSLVGNVSRWVSTITDVRNRLTHLDSTRSGLDGPDLFYLSEGLFAVVRLCMLRATGAPPEVLMEKSTGYDLSWYRERLAAAIESIRKAL